MKKPLLIIFLVLILDQTIKILVKTNMFLGQDIYVLGDWFIIHFTENNGMAFGWEFAGKFGKLGLSVFRILAICAIGWYLFKITKEKEKTGLIISVSLIFAGAIGNIIDSAFYGLIFSESGNFFSQTVASIFPESTSYGTFLHGRVVDMLYFPIIQGYYPDWFPFLGGRDLVFFRPVFNISDSSISVGVFMLIIFQKRYFTKQEDEEVEMLDPVAEDL